MFKHGARQSLILGFGLGGLLAALSVPAAAQQFQLPQQIEQPGPAPQNQQPLSPPILHRVDRAADRLEMTINTSRLLTLDSKIPAPRSITRTSSILRPCRRTRSRSSPRRPA